MNAQDSEALSVHIDETDFDADTVAKLKAFASDTKFLGAERDSVTARVKNQVPSLALTKLKDMVPANYQISEVTLQVELSGGIAQVINLSGTMSVKLTPTE